MYEVLFQEDRLKHVWVFTCTTKLQKIFSKKAVIKKNNGGGSASARKGIPAGNPLLGSPMKYLYRLSLEGMDTRSTSSVEGSYQDNPFH